ncbi:MAG: S8 family serine peptidase [Clostridia bacterium]|nr:S8 family serine peptidase [Clostridia bacterium]
MHKTLSRAVALILCMVLFLTGMPGISAFAVGEDKGPETEITDGKSGGLEDIDPSTLGVKKLGEIEENEGDTDLSGLTPDTSLNDLVRVSIFLKEPSALDAGYSAQGVGKNSSAISYRQNLRAKQKRVQTAIESKLGYKLDVKWNLTLLANAFSTYVYVKDIPEIERMDGVLSVERENRYTVNAADKADPNTSNTSTNMVGASEVWADGYTGAGTRIAIIDTGIDIDHQSFAADAFDYAITKYQNDTGKTADLMTSADIPSGSLNGAGQYQTTKIPYAYNYVDGDMDIIHTNDTEGEHGSHVAGIAAANRFVKSGNDYVDAASSVHAVGMAPDAQLLIMKVFGKGGGAYDSDYMAAIEDAVVLEADAVNLSLGSPNPGYSYANSYQAVFNSLADKDSNAGTVATISAGNVGAITDYLQTDLYIDDVSMHTGGSPGTYINSLGVASADNIGITGAPMIFNGSLNVYYNESDSSGGTMASIVGTYDYVYIDAIGSAEDYSTVDAVVDLKGKVVIVNRGELTFVEKANNAIDSEPKALIIANNQPGVIGMALDDYTGSFPVAAMTLADANAVKAASTKGTAGSIEYYTGSAEITDVIQTEIQEERANATVSDFSSWGVPGSLLMKPEITAPGGNIYSVFGENQTASGAITGGSDQYETMSGTSMAAPHMAGLSALAAQYLKELDVESVNPSLASGYSRRAIIQSLLMSTATPMMNGDDYVSLLQQGAGLADVSKAVTASSVVMMDDAGLTTATGAAADGKVKAELGDDPDRTGEYTYSFKVYNITDKDLTFSLDTDVFTQAPYQYEGELFWDYGTAGLDANVTYSYSNPVAEEHDVNRDGYTNADDAQALLDYLSGENDGSALDLTVGDLNGDGKVSTYDAYLILQLASSDEDGLVVKAHSSNKVTVKISLKSSEKEFLDTYCAGGAYIEGFTSISCTSSDNEGVAYTDEHTIPVLAFYGSWTDASMFDNTSYTDVLYETYKVPYTGKYETNYLTVKYGPKTSVFTGNPYIVEETFPYDALAVNSSNNFGNIYYSLLRSAGTVGFAVSRTDGIGGDVTEVISSSVTNYEVDGLWYYQSQQALQNTSVKAQTVGRSAAQYGLAENDTFRIGFYAIPEYYAMLYNDDMTDADADTLDNAGFSDIIQNNVLGHGAYVGYDFTVDDTAPVISSAVLEGNNISISASDNKNLAYVAVLSLDGSVTYAETAPHSGTYEGTVDASEAVANAEGYVAIFAADYAGNEVAKALQVNDNTTVDPYAVASVTLTPDSLDIYKGNVVILSAEVLPLTVEDREIVWTSSDESVATVDGSGTVTAVGAGTAVITATAHSDSTISATCPVKVTSVDKTLNGIVWDEAGEIFFSSFNAANLPAWSKLSTEPATAEVENAFQADDSTLIAGNLDTSTASTKLYVVGSSYDLTELGDNYLFATDMAPTVFGSYYVYSYGPYLIFGNLEPETEEEGTFSGFPYGLLDASTAMGDDIYIAGVAIQSTNGYGSYYFLDENGTIWLTSVGLSNGRISFTDPQKVVETGISTSFLYQSLYYDGSYIYWSHYADGIATLYIINPSTGDIYNAGDFGDGVWPVSGLYVNGSMAPASTGDKEAAYEIERLDMTRDSFMTAEINNRIKKAAESKKAADAPDGGLNSAPVRSSKLPRTGDVFRFEVEGEGEITGTGDEAVVSLTETVEVTNGLVKVSYPEAFTFIEAESPVYYSAHVNEAERTVTIAYASVAPVPSGEVFAELTFECENTAGETVTVEVEERNDLDTAPEEDPEVIVFGGPEFRTQSVTLSGLLGVNFFLDLPELAGVDYNDSYMIFTVNGKDQRVEFDPMFMNASKKYYGFTCSVNAVQMAEPITAVFHYGEGRTISKTYSVKEYMEVFDANRNRFDQYTIAVFETMSDYGHYIQPFLANANHWTVGVDFKEMDHYYKTDAYDIEAVKAAVADYAIVRDNNSADIEKINYTLTFDTDTIVKVFFKPVSGYTGDMTFTVDGAEYTAELQSDGRYLVAIPDIAAHRLGRTYTIVATTDNGTATVKVSGLSYVNGLLASSTDSVTQNAAASIYYYYAAADAFKNH